MFQYAFGLFLSIKYNCPLYIDKSNYSGTSHNREFALDIFENEARDIENLIRSDLLNEKQILVLKEQHFHFSKEALSPLRKSDNINNIILLISGYWQSEKYFNKIESILRSHFRFKRKLTGKWIDLQINILNVDSIMVNVRRGDYLNHLDIHGVVTIEYLQKAFNYIYQHVENPFFFIFSDDIRWCKENIEALENVFFVDDSFYDSKFASYLQLMASCKHFIISNSTFAWWSAWLSSLSSNKIVIAPSKWFATATLDSKDILPETWIKL